MRPLCALLFSLVALVPSSSAAEGRARGWPDSYGGRDPEARLRGLEKRALDSLRAGMEAAETRPCRPSRRLSKAAQAHAAELLAAGGRGGRVDPGVVRRELLRAGAVDPSVVPWAISFAGELDPSRRLARLAKQHAGRPLTHCGAGLARASDRSVLVVLGVRRRLRLSPFPARVAPGDRVPLAGQLERGYRSPSVVVTTPRGDIVEHPSPRRGARLDSPIDFPTVGRYTVEVMAVGSHGPEAVALFPVFVGSSPDETPGAPGEVAASGEGDEAAEAVLLRLLNDERHRAGLEPLVPDDELARLAAEHSADMIEQGYFGHVSPEGEDVTERLGRSGFVVLRAAENLARSASPRRAHRTLMASPSHRANILDPELTHVGVGIARLGGDLVVTQIFVAW